MPPRKRKQAPQAKLEDLVDEDVKVLKSKTGHLDEPEVKTKQEGNAAATKDEDGEEDMFAKRRAKKMGAESPPKKKQAAAAAAATGPAENPPSTSDSGIWVNRAPVLTLWVSIVAQQQGFSKEAGKAPCKPARILCNAYYTAAGITAILLAGQHSEHHLDNRLLILLHAQAASLTSSL